jgi:hypothetical protein
MFGIPWKKLGKVWNFLGKAWIFLGKAWKNLVPISARKPAAGAGYQRLTALPR